MAILPLVDVQRLRLDARIRSLLQCRYGKACQEKTCAQDTLSIGPPAIIMHEIAALMANKSNQDKAEGH
jgi:hypothetical protein